MAPPGATPRFVTRLPDWRPLTPRHCILLLLLVLPYVCSRPRSDSHSDHDDHYYMNGNIRCRYCPPGTYVYKDCEEPDTIGNCMVCHAGQTYNEHPTGMNQCFTCTKCRNDQEEVSPCTPIKNTVCRCKKGTFCPPDHPCEICQTCSTSCPPDLTIQKPCNSTSDIQCAPPDSAINLLAIVIPVVVVACIIMAGIFWYCMRKNASTQGYRTCWKSNISLITQRVNEEKDTETRPLKPDSELILSCAPEERERTINKIFGTFVDKVPSSEFANYMRNLGLSSNHIYRATQNNPNNHAEQCFAMLKQWEQEQASFNVNTLLNELLGVGMKTVAKDIKEQLIRDGLCVRRPQD